MNQVANNKKDTLNKILSVVSIIVTPIFFISFSALIPCIFRPFYYWSIDPLKIVETSGYSKEVIIEAFDDVMDFLWLGTPFKTGQLAFTESEASHFADCKPLFHLQLILAIVCGLFLLTYLLLSKFKVIEIKRYKNLSPIAIGGMISLGLLVFVGVFAAIDFNTLFKIFHSIAFPGKSNWVFDPYTEQVINILPEEFFLECAIFIVGLTVLLSIVAITIGIVKKVKLDKSKISSK